MKSDKQTQENKGFYDKHFGKYTDVNLLEFNKAGEYEFNKVIEQLDLSKKRNIVEFGAGYGKYSLALAKMGHNVTAVDVSRKGLDILLQQAKKHKLEKRVKVLCTDSSAPAFKNEFDIALCISTYQVVSDTEAGRIRILKNFIAALKPGGTLLMVEPNPLNPLLYFWYLFFPGVQRSIIKQFITSSPFRLQKVLTQLGMNVNAINFVGFLPLRFIKKTPLVIPINEVVNKAPLIKYTSAFSYITAVKKS